MKTWFKLIIVLIIILILGLVVWWGGREEAVAPHTEEPVATTTPDVSDPHANLIRVSAPLSGALVTSPLTVTGEARGTWYFEASFPVRILDANGVELGVVAAQAQGDWMTTEFVPFSAALSFATSTTATGTLVLEKDNPSGLPEHDDHIEIPIKFK